MPSPQFDGIAALPMTPAPAALQIRSRQRTKSSQAESGRILSRAYGGQYFMATLIYNPMKRSEAAGLLAFLQSRQGRNSVFKVQISGLAASGGVAVGNFANFDDDTKLHLITDTSPIAVTPSPRVTGTTLYTDEVFVRASLANDVQLVSLGRGGLIQLEVDIVERL